MNTKPKKKAWICIAAAVIVVSGLVFVLCPPFAYFDFGFHCTSGTEELETGNSSDWSMYFLQFFRDLKRLNMVDPREQDLRYIPDTPSLSALSMYFNEIDDMSAVKAFQNAEYLHFLESRLNFDGFGSDSVTDLSIWSSYIKNFGKIGSFPRLERLELFNCSVSDTEEYSSLSMLGETDWRLTDSSALAGLDSVRSLSISRIKMTDISGILDMDSLEELKTYSSCFCAEDIASLRNAGINVILSDEHEH